MDTWRIEIIISGAAIMIMIGTLLAIYYYRRRQIYYGEQWRISSFTPKACPNCGKLLSSGVCPRCNGGKLKAAS